PHMRDSDIFHIITQRPPRPTLFPYTTLFRSARSVSHPYHDQGDRNMYKPFDLTGHAALVTGGNGGIGLGMARALAQAGAHVAIWGSNPDKTAKARETLVAEGLKVDAFTCDVGDEAAIERTFADTLGVLGKVDACFANAGVSSKGTFMVDMTLEEFRRVQRINVEGVFL